MGEQSVESSASEADPRILRTRRAIVESFVACAAEKPLDSVSIAETCRRAGVNRATFYRHFEDKSDLLARGLDLVLEDTLKAVDSADDPRSLFEERVAGRIEAFFEIVRTRREFYSGLVSGPARVIFASRLEALAADFFADRRLPRMGRIALPEELASRALASSLIAFVAWWLESPRAEGPGEMARLFLAFATRGLAPGVAPP